MNGAGRSVALLSLVAATAPAPAQEHPPSIVVGAVTSERACKTYELTWGRESGVAVSNRAAATDGADAAYARRDAAAFSRSWGTQLVRDCVNQFPALKASVRDALAAAGAAGGGGLVLSAQITNIGTSDGSIDRDGMSDTSSDVVVSVRFAVRQGAREVFGGLLAKHVALSTALQTDSGTMTTTASDPSAYGQLQREVALAIARAVVFHFAPLRIVDAEGGRMRLNYGRPLLSLGATVFAPTQRGLRTIKCRIVSATDGAAIAEVDGSGSLADVAIGAPVQFVEADDPTANAPRYDRVDLP